MLLPDLWPEGGGAAVVLRGLSVCALFVAFGTVLLARIAGPAGGAQLRGLAIGAVLSAIPATAAWGALTAAELSDADDSAALLSALPDVAGTWFGHVLLLRLGLLAAAAVALRRSAGWPALLLLGAAVATQSGHSHGATMAGDTSLLWAAELLHLFAAAAWLGGLPGLFAIVASSPAGTAVRVCRRFGTVALLAVVVLAATALAQGWVELGGWPGLIGTGFGWVILLKLLLFTVLVGFGARHRFRLVGSLADHRRRLLASLAAQAGVGLCVVFAAAHLTGLPPGMHTQPVWPLPWRLSRVTLDEAPEFAPEAWGAVAVVAVGLAACVAAALRRRGRWPLLSAGIAAIALATPHLDLFVVEANPTWLYNSPSGYSAGSIVRGAALYAAHCAACHGAGGAGDGPAAAGLAVPPADLTSAMLAMHGDGDLFWIIGHGIEAPSGTGLAMPGFAPSLDEAALWSLIDYLRARNAAAHPELPRRAPGLDPPCALPPGSPLRLMFGGVVTAAAGAGPPCPVRDPGAAAAYGVVLGRPAEALAGNTVLIDANGWLRGVWPAGESGAVDRALAGIAAHPIAALPAAHAHH